MKKKFFLFFYRFLSTMRPTATAPRTGRMLTGDSGVGVALGQGVGNLAVDFAVIFTVVLVGVGAVVVAVVTSGARTSDASTEDVFAAVTLTVSE